MEHRFDTLAKALAGSVSRREALSRLGGGVAGLLLATLGLGRAWGDPATNSQCEDFCRACPGIAPASGFGECVSSCEACVNSTGGQLPCHCPTSLGGAVVCCTGGQTCCSGQCTNTSSDPNNCGTCGHACTGSQVCAFAVCCLPELASCTSQTPCCRGVCFQGHCVAA